MKQRTAKAMSLKGKVKNIAKAKKLAPHLVLQNFMMERFLNRLAVSRYKEHFIVKGGTLIAALMGIENRTTMDIDVTIRNLAMDRDVIADVMCEVGSIQLNDDTEFEYQGNNAIRKDDLYGGFRSSLIGWYDFKSICVPFTIDITTGDVITPAPCRRVWKSLLSGDDIFELWSYSVETILAEKLEAILSKGAISTRPRDFYDVKMILQTQPFDETILKNAFQATCGHRGSINNVQLSISQFNKIETSPGLQRQWKDYASHNSYASDFSFSDVIQAVKTLLPLVTPGTN